VIQVALESVLFDDKLANWMLCEWHCWKATFCTSQGTAVTHYRWSVRFI